MGEYQSFHCSVLGFKHGPPCQDSSICLDEGRIHIAVTADGHGDHNCFRSYLGARAACRITQTALLSFAKTLEESGREKELFEEKRGKELITHLFENILGTWTEKVTGHALKNPPTEEELSGAEENTAAVYRQNDWLQHMYGTTLIAALMTDRYLLMLHQGDGRCTVIHADGSLSQPVPWDSRCYDVYTTSLCDEDASSSWRHALIDLRQDPVIAVLCSSDGIEDSFNKSMERLDAYFKDLMADFVDEGKEHFMATLVPHFSSMSEYGSRDDITLSAILDADALAPLRDRYRLEAKRTEKEIEFRAASGRLEDMDYKANYLEQQVRDAEEVCARMKKEADRGRGLFENLRESDAKEEKHTLALEEAKRKLEKAKQERDEYAKLHEEVMERAAAAQKELERLDGELAVLMGLKERALPSGEAATPARPAEQENEAARRVTFDEEADMIFEELITEAIERNRAVPEKAPASSEDETEETTEKKEV